VSRARRGDRERVNPRDIPAYSRGMRTHLAVAVMIAMSGSAAAEGERTPMLGGAVTLTDAQERRELLGGELELAWWAGRIGLAIEAAARRDIIDEDGRSVAVAGSARLLVADWLWPSLFEPRDVEAGVELQAIAERAWWSRDDHADALGLGLALRVRGGSDWQPSELLAESRLFVRVMRSRGGAADAVARAAEPTMVPAERGGTTVVVGLGVAFGVGTRHYLERFRRRPFDSGSRR
jgi:hypothetical protein